MYAVISRSDPKKTVGAKTDNNPLAIADVRAVGTAMQRSSGTVELVIAQKNGISRVMRAFQQGAMKARFPNVVAGDPPEAVLLNTAGGLTGGDRQEISIGVEEDASAVITTQACERIYRSLGDDANIVGHINLDAGAKLEWLPQPVIFFNGARLKRETQVHLSAEARFLAVESVIFGRTASGEAVEYGALSDAWFVRRAGRLVHAERFDAGGSIRTILDKPSVLGGHRAMATIRYFASDAAARLGEMRDLLEPSTILAAASAWNGIMLVRFVAPDGYSLNRELMRVLSGFRRAPLPRVWSL